MEETLLDKAKRLYPIGTKVKSPCDNNTYIIEGDIILNSSGHIVCQKCTIYYNYDSGKWAEIIEPVKKELTNLPDKWCIKRCDSSICEWVNKKFGTYYHTNVINGFIGIDVFKKTNIHFDNIQIGYIEITFEQFKKWVLKEPVKTVYNDNLSQSDLIDGEVYYAIKACSKDFLVRKGGIDNYICISGDQSGFNSVFFYGGYSFKLATFSEREWFNKCEKAGKFIPKEEALKTSGYTNHTTIQFKKYTISELLANRNLVVRCTNKDQINIIGPLIQEINSVSNPDMTTYNNDIILFSKRKGCIGGFNPTSAIKPNEILVEYSDVIFDEPKKPGIDFKSVELPINYPDFYDKSLLEDMEKYSYEYDKHMFGISETFLKNIPPYMQLGTKSKLEFQSPVIIKKSRSKKSKFKLKTI